MNVAAKVKRVLGNFRALSAAGVAALLFTAPAYAASLNGPSTGSAAVMPIAVDFVNGDDSNQVVVHGGIKADEYTVSRLTAPDRVVIDVLNHPQGKNKSFDTSDSRFVEGVRFGSHPDKSRIVLDLNSQENAAHDARLENGDLVVTIKPGNGLAGASDARAEMKKNTYAADPHVTSEANKTKNANTASAESKKVWPRLTGLSIENADGNNSVIADMTAVSGYTLKQSAPSEYVLTLKGATLDESASSSLVSPQGTGDIRAARPVAQGADVAVRIFTAPEVTLEAKNRGGKIIVSSLSMTTKADGRAQFAPEAADKKAPAKKTDTVAAPAITNAGTGTEKAPVAPVIKAPTAAAAPVKAAAADAGAGEGGDELSALLSNAPKYNGRLISLDLQDTDIDNALRIIAEVSNLNIIASDAVTGKVTLRLIDVPWDQALDVILKTNNLDKVQEGNVIRIAPVEALKSERESLKQAQQAEDELEALTVRYVRISYAKAAELKPLVETVLSERGSVAYDERTNQLIVKDINKGVKNVAQLIAKLDLRTPQVLLETQILEAQRNMLRDLGAELGFSFIRSPATGNATGYNFPNSIAIGGALGGSAGALGSGVASAFPAAVSTDKGGAGINLLFGSADGSATIGAKITALESEGRVRIVSRPAVATTNNKQAIIKAVEKIRIKTPSGGTSVATGAGASASGGSGVATEVVEIGITLQVTPQASPDYFVLLDISAKSSTFGSRTVDGIPSEVERSANSTVLVSSGQTFALGGIYKITDQDFVDGVPFLKDIPFFGALFRRQKVDNRDEELVIFVTPRIIEGSFDDAAMKAGA